MNGQPQRVFGMGVDITDRKLAQEAIRESEERFRLVTNTAPVLIWMSGEDKLCTFFNDTWLEFTGQSLESQLGNGWAEGVHPDDLQKCLDIYTGAFDRRERFRMEYRLRRYDGAYRWIVDIGVPRFNPDRSFAGYIGSCIDVTESKLAEEALSSVSRRLIEAQEQERTRIARELHDDINQRIALLSIELGNQHQLEISAHLKSVAASKLQETHSGIAKDVHAISHRLHSSQLEYLGIVAAMRGFCQEFSDQQNVEIDFRSHDFPVLCRTRRPCAFSGCLQEALQNAAKYSGCEALFGSAAGNCR